MPDAFYIDLVAFIVFGLGLANAQNRYYRYLAATTGEVSTNKEVLDRFTRDLRGMPAENLDETRRR